MSEGIRILIADDEPEVRRVVRRALERSPRLHVVAEAPDGVKAWEYVKDLKPDIAIIDIGMPEMDGMALARRIRKERLPVNIIFLTVCEEKEMVDAALELGMKGYLLKHYTGDEILKSVEAVAAGEHCASPPVVSHMIRERQRRTQQPPGAGVIDDLTLQERAILRRIAQHKSSKEIASEMGISVRTVDTHRSNICKKLGIHGNYGLSRYADGGGGN
jgi:DNA-binding NarL/FixJ family response regulator